MYNLTNGGEGFTGIHTENTRRKLRAARKRRPKHLEKPRLKREIRVCKCGCNQKFECIEKYNKRYIQFHHLRNRPSWNTGLTKDTDERVLKYSETSRGSRLGYKWKPESIVKRSRTVHRNALRAKEMTK